jgi:hypothetical protein
MALPVTETTPYTDERGNPTAPQPSSLGGRDPGVRQDPANVTGQSPYTRQHVEGRLGEITPQELTPEDQEKCDALYEELKPQATQEARDYVLARTPALYQEAMIAKIEADWPAPPVEDPALTESRRHDRDSYKRSADVNPNLNPDANPNVGYTPVVGQNPEYPNYPQR